MGSVLVERFSLRGPIVQAPLGGGPGTPELTAAVCNAGGLGSIAGAYLTADQLRDAIRATRKLTPRPFAVNLFIPSPVPCLQPERIQHAIDVTAGYRKELELPQPVLVASPFEDFAKQMNVIFEEKPAALSFVFGELDKNYLDECRRLGIFTIGTATGMVEGMLLSSCDAIVAQGREAGGHRGMFAVDAPDSNLSTEQLVRELHVQSSVPLIAAGGLMTGTDIARALNWGADAAQLGTAFLLCPETGTSRPYRQALRHPRDAKLTRVFSGRLARGIENRFMVEMTGKPEAVLPWPTQNAFTRDLRTQSAKLGKGDFLSLWAGTGVGAIREMPASDLVETLLHEIREARA
jgi:nitronate monooxygenase